MTESIWIARDGASFGPYTLDQLRAWIADGTVASHDRAYAANAGWTTAAQLAGGVAGTATPPPIPSMAVAADANEGIVRSIAQYERISAIVWAVIAFLQIISVVAIIAGVWNAYAAYTRFRLVPHIEARNRHVPAAFESIAGLVIIGAINLFLGGGVGVLGVVMDFVVRDHVLKNRHVFDREAGALDA